MSPFCVRWGECARPVGASQLRCRVRSLPQGFLPQHDLGQGSAAAPAQAQAQCEYLCLSAALVLVSITMVRPRERGPPTIDL